MALHLKHTVKGESLMRIRSEFGMARYSSPGNAIERIKKKLPKGNAFAEKLSAGLDVKIGQSEA